MLKTVFVFEWKKVSSAVSFRWAVALLLVISGYALQNGQHIIRQQNDHIEKAIRKEASVFQEVVAQIQHPDTSTEEGKWRYAHLTDASWTITSPNKRWTSYWRPAPASFLSVGNRDIYPYYHELEPLSFYMRFFKSEISSPLHLLFGNFDLAFVLVFLFPLFIIAFTFDSYSSEVENGTYPLISSIVSASVVVNYKLLFYWMFTAMLLNLVLLFSAFLASPFMLHSWLSWLLLANAYLLVWFFFAWVVSRFKKSSVFNAIVFLSWWIGLAIGFPALFNSVAQAKYPVNSEAFSPYIRRVQMSSDTLVLKKNVVQFAQLYPAYANTDVAAHLLTGKAYIANGEFNDRKGDQVLAVYLDQMQKRDDFLNRCNFINPVTRCQQAFNEIAQTDLPNYIRYVKSARLYQQTVKETLTRKYFTGQEMTIQELQHRLSFDQFLRQQKTNKHNH